MYIKTITRIDFRDTFKNDFHFVFSFFGVFGLFVFSGFCIFRLAPPVAKENVKPEKTKSPKTPKNEKTKSKSFLKPSLKSIFAIFYIHVMLFHALQVHYFRHFSWAGRLKQGRSRYNDTRKMF